MLKTKPWSHLACNFGVLSDISKQMFAQTPMHKNNEDSIKSIFEGYFSKISLYQSAFPTNCNNQTYL